MTRASPAGGLPVAGPAEVRSAVREILGGERRALAALLLLNLLAAAAGLALPWLFGRIVDVVRSGGATAVDGPALAVLGCALAHLLLTRWALLAGHRFGERTVARMREGFVHRLLELPLPVVERAGIGDLTTRGTTDVATVGFTVRHALPEVFISAVQAVFILVVLFFLHPVLGVCGVAGLPVLILVTRWYLRRARPAYLAEGDANSRLAESLSATAEGARSMEAFGLRRRRTADGDRRIAEVRRARVRTLRLRSVLFPVVDFSHALPTGLTLLVGGLLVSEGWVSLGAVVAACLYTVRLAEPVDTVLLWMDQMQSGAASLARVRGVEGAAEDEAPGEPTPRRSVPRRSAPRRSAPGRETPTALRACGVRYSYPRGGEVVAGVDLEVRSGERLAIVGPSGSGKSTLARLLAGLARPEGGRVTVDGWDVSALPPPERRRRPALVTQEHHVFRETLRFNLALAAPHADAGAMLAALAAVGADAWASALPEGLDTVLGETGTAVDPGQAQRLALARVVLADARTVILDEATAMLDPGTARRAERSLAGALRGRTQIAIAHRLHTAHDADRVAVMERGRIVELGEHDALIRRGGSYAALWRAWHGSTADP